MSTDGFPRDKLDEPVHPACETRSTTRIVEDAQNSQGWTDYTLLILLIDYIEAQDSNAAFADFIEEKKT